MVDNFTPESSSIKNLCIFSVILKPGDLACQPLKILIVKSLLVFFTIILLYGCKKENIETPPIDVISPPKTDTTKTFIKYTIFKGQHYCDKSILKSFTGNEINFKVKFDSSAIYKTVNPDNQGDINKLYGFSEGADNHLNSARIGWVWYKNELHLYAYVYSAGVRRFKEITSAAIGAEQYCSITISGSKYLFKINESELSMDRALEGPAVAGLWQYPYFGGDEPAPDNTYIYLMDITK